MGHQAPPERVSPVAQLAEYAGRVLVDVAGYAAVEAALAASPVGSRGIMVIDDADGGVSHVVNVVHDGNGVVFLDGEHGRQARGPAVPRRVRFVATTPGVAAPVVVDSPVVMAGDDVAGMDSSGDVAGGETAGTRLDELREWERTALPEMGPVRPDMATVRDVVWAAEMEPVLKLRLAEARRGGGDAGALAAAEAALGRLRQVVAVADLPVRSLVRRLANADAAEVRGWVEVAEGFAEAERGAAAVGGPEGVVHWRKAVLFSAFPVMMGALGQGGDELRGQDFLPLVHHVVDNAAATVSDEHLARIDGYVGGLMAAGRPVTLAGMVRWHAYTVLVEAVGVEPAPAVVGPVVAAAGLDGRAAVERVAEVRSLLAAAEGVAAGGFVGSDRDRAELVNELVSMVQRRYAREHGGASMAGPVSVGDVAELVGGGVAGGVGDVGQFASGGG